MKLVIFFLCVSLTHLSAHVYAQQALVNLKLENTSLIQILQEVEKQLKQDFFFSKEEINVKQKLSINFSKATLDEVVRTIFGPNYKYRIIDNVIVISPVKESPEEIKKITIRGKVMDKDSIPIPGVTIKIKETNLGVATDKEGKFSLTFPEMKNPTLVFTFIGMQKQEIPIQTQTMFLNVIM